ncbi:MAG: glycosyltransferase [Chthoniobacterales bacterium]|nr:glycosyltransferase [Chthoniobacterales bacterium]
MRILRCIHSLDPAIGGPLESVKQSTLVLQKRGHEVEIVCLDAPNEPSASVFPAPVHALGPGRGSYGYTSRLLPWLRANRSQFDTVVVHGIWQYPSFAVWRALHRTATPYFVFPHGMLDPWFNRTYPLKRLKKLLYWPWAEYRVLRDAAAVLFTSEEERLLARESFSLYRARERVVNYGTAAPEVDWPAAQEKFFTQFPQLRGRKFFLFLGRLAEKKGVDVLLRAFRSLGETSRHLVLAGPCANEKYRAHLLRLAEGLPVVFTGMLSGETKWGALRAADIFVLPSHQENFGIAIAEALACGTPVLISNKINIWREVVADGGGWVEEDDLAGVTRLLQRWRAVTPEVRQGMSAKAAASFRRRFEINRAVDSFLQVLQEG